MSDAIRSPLTLVVQALDAGDLARARALIDSLHASHPRDLNVRLLGAVLARREGRLQDALDTLLQLRAEMPEQTTVTFQLGNVLKDAHRPAEAAEQYRSVLEQRRDHTDAAFNLAVCLRQTDNVAEAGRWFLQAARHGLVLREGLQHALGCAAELAEHPPEAAPFAPPSRDGSISVVCCSIEPHKLATLRANLSDVLAGQRWELIHIGDARSLSEGYNRGIAQAQGDAVILCHDDIRVLAPGFAPRLLSHLQRFELIGVAGATRCTGPAALWAAPPYIHGWVTHRDGDRRMPSLCSAYGPVIDGAQTLDGVFLAARRDLFERLRFDDVTFDGFHLYDVDFCWRAHLAGVRIGICQDLMIEHASRGNFGADWSRYADRFRLKFPELGNAPPDPQPKLFEIAASDDRHVRGIYAWIGHWLRTMDGVR